MAENSNDEKDLQEEKKIDSNLREIISRASKNRELTKDEIKKLEDEAKQSLNFLEKINEIEIPKDKYVVFIDGTQQLVYDNGEFFLEDTLDSTKKKEKIKRAKAREIYIEYFIRNVLNKISVRNEVERKLSLVKEKKKEIPTKESKKKDLKEEVVLPDEKVESKSIIKPKEKDKNNDLVR